MVEYNFVSPYSHEKTREIVLKSCMRMGKVKDDRVCIKVKKPWHWKMEFYIQRADKDCRVRCVMRDCCSDIPRVWVKRDLLWDRFLVYMNSFAPGTEWGISVSRGNPNVIGAVFLDDGVQQVHMSRTKKNPSLVGFLAGGMIFGGAGAIVGGMSGKSRTDGRTYNTISNVRLVRVMYDNGRIWEGEVRKKSALYNEILLNLTE